MRYYLRIAIAIVLIYFGVEAIQHEFGGRDVGLFNGFDYIPLVIVIILTIPVLLLDHSAFRVDKRLFQYSFSLIALGICSVVVFKILSRSSIENSRTILKVVSKEEARQAWRFDFRENEHFTLKDYNILGHTVYYGKYKRKGDVLTIIESNYDGDLKEFPMAGRIRGDTVFWEKFDTMLIQKD